MRIRYTYRAYPYSKRATNWSHLAVLFRVYAIIAIMAGAPIAIMYAGLGDFSTEFWASLLFAIGGIAYLVLYIRVIVPKIEEMANKDRAEAVRNGLKGKKVKLTKEDFEK